MNKQMTGTEVLHQPPPVVSMFEGPLLLQTRLASSPNQSS